MSEPENIIITEVTKKNFKDLFPLIVADVKASSFIAIDAEMSGLGSTKQTMNSNLNDRYNAISSFASTRSIISLGLACFSCLSSFKELGSNEKNKNVVKYNVSVYNIILLCCEPYIVDPSALEFLVNHGFNFNKQFSEGIPYYRGNDKANEKCSSFNMRNLFNEIVRLRKPLVLHNGLTDLIFMYQCFYANCPQNLTALMADISEIFPSGVYDTKYIAEFLDHTPASFLVYLFRYSVLKNEELQDQEKSCLEISFSKGNVCSSFLSLYKNIDSSISSTAVCLKYAAYGWCVQGTKCKKNHDIDAIIEMHKSKTSRKRKRKEAVGHSEQSAPKIIGTVSVDNSSSLDKQKLSEHVNSKANFSNGENSDSIQTSEIEKNDLVSNGKVLQKSKNDINQCKGHRSGIDAFMTGYIFSVFFVSRSKVDEATFEKNDLKDFSDSIPFFSKDLQSSVVNKLFLSGKSIPLSVCKSSYTKTSKNHNEKLLKVYLK